MAAAHKKNVSKSESGDTDVPDTDAPDTDPPPDDTYVYNQSHDKSHGHGHGHTARFARCGLRLVNLAHVVSVGLPPEGEPGGPVTLELVTGSTMTLTGDDAAAVRAALDGCCSSSEGFRKDEG